MTIKDLLKYIQIEKYDLNKLDGLVDELKDVLDEYGDLIELSDARYENTLEGFKNKRGEPYPARKFEEILKNVFYIGKFIWAGQLYDGKHKAIIDKKIFYRVQDMFKKTDKPIQNDKNFTYSKFI